MPKAILGNPRQSWAILHYTDLKRWVMKPNFQLGMYTKDNFASIMVPNTKTGNPLKDWRICDATDCEGYLAIKKHETKNDRILDVKETTPLTWYEGMRERTLDHIRKNPMNIRK